MKKQEIVLTVGLPGSGKTTAVNELIARDPDYVSINRDDIRLMLQGQGRYRKFQKWREKATTNMSIECGKAALAQGKSIIISDTNLDPNRRQKWKDLAAELGVGYRDWFFTDVPYGVCIERDMKREFPVGTKVIMGMHKKYKNTYWPAPVYDESLEDCWIVDVDGTLAEMNGRSPYEWMKVETDLPRQDIIDIVNSLYDAGNKIIIMSGRDGVCKEMTTDWLINHNVKFHDFFIRPEGDNRKDYVIKKELYESHIKDIYNVKGILDDRDQVIHLWRHLGFTCLQVNYGSF